MSRGLVVWLTDLDLGISEVARAVEERCMESLFLTEHTAFCVATWGGGGSARARPLEARGSSQPHVRCTRPKDPSGQDHRPCLGP
jgi:hypothetical protein